MVGKTYQLGKLRFYVRCPCKAYYQKWETELVPKVPYGAVGRMDL
jgi:hypothetical protein